jgi:hypothetical protein
LDIQEINRRSLQVFYQQTILFSGPVMMLLIRIKEALYPQQFLVKMIIVRNSVEPKKNDLS